MQMYVDLVKRAVNNYLYLGGAEEFGDYETATPARYENFSWKIPELAQPHSLLDRHQLDLIEALALDLDARHVGGDFIEAGVWRGGVIVFMQALVNAYAMKRKVVAADSFAGIPELHVRDDPVAQWKDRWCASLDQVRMTLERYGMSAASVVFMQGNFCDPSFWINAQLRDLALVRIDCDSYEATIAALNGLYPKLASGGYVLVDDGHLPGCLLAVLEFRKNESVSSELQKMGNNLYWIK